MIVRTVRCTERIEYMIKYLFQSIVNPKSYRFTQKIDFSFFCAETLEKAGKPEKKSLIY